MMSSDTCIKNVIDIKHFGSTVGVESIFVFVFLC